MRINSPEAKLIAKLIVGAGVGSLGGVATGALIQRSGKGLLGRIIMIVGGGALTGFLGNCAMKQTEMDLDMYQSIIDWIMKHKEGTSNGTT